VVVVRGFGSNGSGVEAAWAAQEGGFRYAQKAARGEGAPPGRVRYGMGAVHNGGHTFAGRKRARCRARCRVAYSKQAAV